MLQIILLPFMQYRYNHTTNHIQEAISNTLIECILSNLDCVCVCCCCFFFFFFFLFLAEPKIVIPLLARKVQRYCWLNVKVEQTLKNFLLRRRIDFKKIFFFFLINIIRWIMIQGEKTLRIMIFFINSPKIIDPKLVKATRTVKFLKSNLDREN